MKGILNIWRNDKEACKWGELRSLEEALKIRPKTEADKPYYIEKLEDALQCVDGLLNQEVGAKNKLSLLLKKMKLCIKLDRNIELIESAIRCAQVANYSLSVIDEITTLLVDKGHVNVAHELLIEVEKKRKLRAPKEDETQSKETKSWKKMHKKINTFHQYQNSAVGFDIFYKLSQAGFSRDIGEVLRWSCNANNISKNRVEIVMDIFSKMVDISSRVDSAGSIQLEATKESVDFKVFSKMVFVCGVGYTGSGAVSDYLKQSNKTKILFDGHEARGVTGSEKKGTYASLLVSANKDFEINFHSLVVFIFSNVLGLKKSATKRYKHFQFGEKISKRLVYDEKESSRSLVNIKTSSMNEIYNMVTALEYFVDVFNENFDGGLSHNLFVTRLTMFMKDILGIDECAGNLYIMNNVLKGWEIDQARLFPGSKIIVVDRDPRDQYVDSRDSVGTAYTNWTPDQFIKFRNNKVRSIMRASDDSVYPTSIKLIGFEDFLCNDMTKKELIEWLGVGAPSFVEDRNVFDGEASKKNISKYKREDGQIMDKIRIESLALPMNINAN